MNSIRIEGGGDAAPFVLEAGIGGSDVAWHWLRAFLARQALVLSSDRTTLRRAAGGGAHDAALRPLLWEHLRLPAVMIGHSLGALYALRYALLHPRDVRALVLLDPAPDDPMIYPGSPSRLWRALFMAATQAQAGLLQLRRLRASLGLSAPSAVQLAQLREAGLPEDIAAALAHQFTEPDFLGNLAHEVRATAALQAEVQRLMRSAALPPVLVISAGRHAPATGAIARYYEMAAQRHLALSRLSAGSEHRVLAQADHNSIVARREHAQEAARMILDFCARLS